MRKREKMLIIVGILVLASLIVLSFLRVEEERMAGLQKLTFRMNWIPYAEHAPVWVAKQKGYYREAGLDVEVVYGKGSTLSAKLVAAGDSDFGMCAGDTALMSITKELPIKVVAVMVQKSPVAIVSLKNKGIGNPTDLYGKKLGINVQSTKYMQYKAFAEVNSLDTNEITEVPVEPAAEIPALLEGKIDALLDFSYESDAELARKGYEINKIMVEDHGVHVYGSSLIVNKQLLEQNPELVGKFVKATLRGWDYALAHPEEAIDIFVNQHPELDKEAEVAKLYGLIPLVKTELTEEKGVGYQSLETWQQMQETLMKLELIEKRIALDQVYTTDFLQ